MLINLSRPKNYALNRILFTLILIGLTAWLGFMGSHATSAPAFIENNRSPRQVAASTLTARKNDVQVTDAYGKLPLQFEINEEQSDARVSAPANEPDPSPVKNTATITTTEATQADLSVTVTDSPDPIALGNNVTYTVTVTNSGPDTATGLLLSDTLPNGVNFVSASSTAGTLSTQVGGIQTYNIPFPRVPDRFPSDLPLEESGNAVTQNYLAAAHTTPTDFRFQATRVFITTRTLDDAIAIYRNYFIGHGWTLSSDQSADNFRVILVQKDGLLIQAAVDENTVSHIRTVNLTLTCPGLVWNSASMSNGAIATITLVVKPSTSGVVSNVATVYANEFDPAVSNNTATATTNVIVSISGRVTDGSNKGISGVQVTLSGVLTQVVQTDANGNYTFNDLVSGGNYSVIASSPFYVFAPPRFDFTNLSGNQTANFAQVPQAVPSPTPALVDNFAGAQRDPQKWNLGTATQPAGAFDPQVTVAQTEGQLVIAPRSNVSGPHYNGYVSVDAFDLTSGTASVEMVKAATAGADTIFSVGRDSNNFYRFMVHTTGPSGSAMMIKGTDGEVRPLLDPTVPQLLLQVVIAGQLTTLPIPYDPVQHHFMRFRHESALVSPPYGAIVFEASPDDINFTPLRRTPLDRGLDPMTIELSAGTTGPTTADSAKFDNVKLVLSTFEFSSGTYTVGEGEGSVQITVTREGDKSTAGTVDFATADGTALQGAKYLNAAGTLTFAAGESSKTFTVSIVDNALAEGNQTLNLLLSNPTTSGLNSPGRAVLTIIDNETVLAANQVTLKTWTFSGRTYAYLKLSFPNAGYRVANWGQAVRTGNDFAADATVEKFTGASVLAVTTTAQIYDLGPLADGNYTFTFKNSGTLVKSQAFTVSSAAPQPNPIDTAREFVKQQYRDFLNREADQAGEDFWTDNITLCSNPARRPAGQTEAQCTLRQRETTSGAFFRSPEFQYTGDFVLRMYKGALGRQPKLSEFIPDAQFVGAGILVNGQLSAAKINQNKADFAQQFVNCTDATKYRCAEFKAIYDGLNNQQYVDKLFQTTGVNASASDRMALVNGLNAIPATETRASVLQKVVDGIVVIAEGSQTFTTSYGQAFYNSESNRAFVQLEYFGYMKRDPDDAGYAFWLGKLNQFGGNFVNAEMVLAFISSPEYRARFGQP